MIEKNNRRSLKQLVIVSVGVLLLCLLLGNFMLSLVSSRDYLERQMQSHAQDAATALGLTISGAVADGDLVSTERIIDIIFDSGDYQSIHFVDTQGNVLVERYVAKNNDSVPDWFVSFIPIRQSGAQAKVMSGWEQRGLINLVSNTDAVYGALWHRLQSQFTWLLVMLVFGLVVLYFLLRTLLRPLEDMESYANALGRNRFEARLAVPSTRELASVASALNNMTTSLGRVFGDQLDAIELLRQQARLDALTGLFNREGFDNRLKADLDAHHGVRQGALGLIMINEFESINAKQGREAGDALLVEVG